MQTNVDYLATTIAVAQHIMQLQRTLNDEMDRILMDSSSLSSAAAHGQLASAVAAALKCVSESEARLLPSIH